MIKDGGLLPLSAYPHTHHSLTSALVHCFIDSVTRSLLSQQPCSEPAPLDIVPCRHLLLSQHTEVLEPWSQVPNHLHRPPTPLPSGSLESQKVWRENETRQLLRPGVLILGNADESANDFSSGVLKCFFPSCHCSPS